MNSQVMLRKNLIRRYKDRKGAVLVLAAVMMFMLLAFLAFTVDTGFLASSEAEMARSADAAAIAGCWKMYDGMVAGNSIDDYEEAIRNEAAAFASNNHITNKPPQLSVDDCDNEDVEIGYLPSMTSNSIDDCDEDLPFMGVRVTVRRTAQRNGEIPYFFGRIFGNTGRPMTAKATAVMAQNISGFKSPGEGDSDLPILPIALDMDTWEDIGSSSNDNFKVDLVTGAVTSGSDGFPEVNLYPQGNGSPGNRGTVDIGGSNNSTADIARQIVHGISSADLAALDMPLHFNSGVLKLNGDTGISAGVNDELASIIGKTRVIPVFSNVSCNGNNAQYTIVKWVGVRILAVQLTGPMSQKKLVVQPAPIIARNTVVSTSSSSKSEYVFSPVTLVQ